MLSEERCQEAVDRPCFESFADFWPYYLGEHRHPLNRQLHVLGTTLALGLISGLCIAGLWPLMGLGVLVGYALAWTGHFCVEKNKPATFGHVWFSLRGDLRMWQLAWRGRLAVELERHGLSS